MKNLDFLLSVLQRISLPIHLSVYGPIEDLGYWNLCKRLINDMPLHVCVDYMGEVPPSDVPNIFASADVFLFPTLGENFGHVILEALSVGTPVLTSDQTPWRGDSGGGLEELSLEDMSSWLEHLESWAIFSDSILLSRRRAALDVAQNFLSDPSLFNATRVLFAKALKTSSGSSVCVE